MQNISVNQIQERLEDYLCKISFCIRTNDTNEEQIIIIYKGYSLARKKASAKYYNANKDKCIERSRRWAIEHKMKELIKTDPKYAK